MGGVPHPRSGWGGVLPYPRSGLGGVGVPRIPLQQVARSGWCEVPRVPPPRSGWWWGYPRVHPRQVGMVGGTWGTPQPGGRYLGYPSGQVWMMGGTWGTPWPGLDGGGTWHTPSQVGVSGYPPGQVWMGGGTWGTPSARSGWYPGYPPPGLDGVPPTPIRQSSIARTCYLAGSMPFAFTQEDFLVFLFNFWKT